MNNFVNKSLYIFTVLFLIILFLFVFKEVFVFFLPIIVAYLIAKTIQPLKNLLHKKLKFPVQLATIISMMVIITLLAILFYFVGSLIIGQLSSLGNDLPELGNSIYTSIINAIDNIESLVNFTPFVFDDLFKNVVDFTVTGLGDFSKNIGLYVIDFLTFLPSLFFYVLIAIISTYYISNDLDHFKDWLKKMSHKFTLFEKIKDTFRNDILFALVAYLKAQGILMIITFFIVAIGLFLMQYKYFLLIALGVAVLDALPIFGTGTVFGPWIVIQLLNADYRSAIFLTVIYIVATLVRQTLQPKILSSQIGLNPLLTLISIYVGIRLLGVFGIILGPMLLILSISIGKVVKNTNIN